MKIISYFIFKLKDANMGHMENISRKIEDTKKLAEDFIKKINKGKNAKATIVGLYGDLGVGKTAFSKAVAKELGIKRGVNSPTFVIMKKHKIPKNSIYNQYKYFVHIDAYRLKDEKELVHLGWDEIISNREHLVFIEWPEQIRKAIPKKHHQIHIFHKGNSQRKFRIKYA